MTFIIADYQDITRLGIVGLIKETFDDKTQTITADTLPSLSALLDNDGESVSAVVVDCIGCGKDCIDLFPLDDIQELANQYPHIMWVLFSNEIPETIARRFASEKNFSILLKSANSEEIVSTLRLAFEGERFICHEITNILFNNQQSETFNELTETETEILKLTALGKSVKEIANERNSSFHTINTHKRNIFRKLGVNSSHEATRYAIRTGLVDLIEYYI